MLDIPHIHVYVYSARAAYGNLSTRYRKDNIGLTDGFAYQVVSHLSLILYRHSHLTLYTINIVSEFGTMEMSISDLLLVKSGEFTLAAYLYRAMINWTLPDYKIASLPKPLSPAEHLSKTGG